MVCKNNMGAESGISTAIAEGCGGGCPEQPPMRYRFLVDRISVANRMTAGDEVVVDIKGNVPLRDPLGRHAHVVGIEIQGQRRFSVTNAVSGAVSRRLMLRAGFENLFLEDASGHQYMAALHGGNVWDHHWIRYGVPDPLMSLVDDIQANIGVADYDRLVALKLQLAHSDKRGGGVIPFQGAIPLALLAARETALRWRVPTAIPTAPAAVTLGAWQGTFVNVWIEVIYLEQVVNAPAWNVEQYTKDDLSGSLRHADRMTEFAVLRFDEEDTAAQDIDDYTGANSVTNAGMTLMDGLSLAELEERDTLALISDPIAAGENNVAGFQDGLPYLVGGVPQVAFLVPPVRNPEAWPAGRVGYNFTARTQHTTNRFLHRTVLCHDPRREAMLAGLTGCNPSRVVPQGLCANGLVDPGGPTNVNTHILQTHR